MLNGAGPEKVYIRGINCRLLKCVLLFIYFFIIFWYKDICRIDKKNCHYTKV